MLLGFNRILLGIVIGAISYTLVGVALDVMLEEASLKALLAVPFTVAGFIAVAFQLRHKLNDTLDSDELSISEAKNLNLLVKARRQRLDIFIVISVVLAAMPIVAQFFNALSKELLSVIVYVLAIGYIEILYFFVLICLSFGEIEDLNSKLSSRKRKNKKAQELLDKLEK